MRFVTGDYTLSASVDHHKADCCQRFFDGFHGKIGGLRLLEKAFSTDEYSKEDLQYIAYIKKNFPNAEFIEFENMGHAGMASLYPQKMVKLFDLIS